MEREMIVPVGDSVVRNVAFVSENRTIVMGPNSILHSVRIRPDVVILNAAFDEELAKRHSYLFPREESENYMKFLAECGEHTIEAQRVAEAIGVLRETTILSGRMTLNVGRKADDKGD